MQYIFFASTSSRLYHPGPLYWSTGGGQGQIRRSLWRIGGLGGVTGEEMGYRTWGGVELWELILFLSFLFSSLRYPLSIPAPWRPPSFFFFPTFQFLLFIFQFLSLILIIISILHSIIIWSLPYFRFIHISFAFPYFLMQLSFLTLFFSNISISFTYSFL